MYTEGSNVDAGVYSVNPAETSFPLGVQAFGGPFTPQLYDAKKASASRNISDVSAPTPPVHEKLGFKLDPKSHWHWEFPSCLVHPETSCAKLFALSNIHFIFPTLLVFQPETFPLNFVASQNMSCMDSALDVSHVSTPTPSYDVA